MRIAQSKASLSNIEACAIEWAGDGDGVNMADQISTVQCQSKPLDTQIAVALKQALELHKHGDLTGAANIYAGVLKADPFNFDALHLSGVIAFQQNRVSDAEEYFVKAMKTKFVSASFLLNYGLFLNSINRYVDALVVFDKATSIDPNSLGVSLSRGIALRNLGRIDDALKCFESAASLNDKNPDIWSNMGEIFVLLHDMDKAIFYFCKAAALNQDHGKQLNKLANSLHVDKKYSEARKVYEKSVLLGFADFSTFFNYGQLLSSLNFFESAIDNFEKALAISPNDVQCLFCLGNALNSIGRFEDAIVCYDKALSFKPLDHLILMNRGNSLKDLHRFDDALVSYKEALNANPKYFYAHSNILFFMNYVDHFSVDHRIQEARRFGENVSKFAKKFTTWNTSHCRHALRVGFVSPDFRNHPVGYFLEGVLSKIDAAKLECYAYSTNPLEDDLTERLKQNFKHWKSLFNAEDFQAASIIHADQINILIDLSGHTAGGRLPIFACKPAPIQISWLGYFATTGLKEMDYILGDPFVTPTCESHHFSEKIKQLPDAYLCFTAPEYIVEVGDLPAIKNGFVTFGSFNNFAKINDEVISLWAEVLQAVPGSRLVFKARQLKNSAIVSQTRDLFASFGIEPRRLSFEIETSRVEYFRSYNKIDIMLDPFPYPGGTISAESLWMGVPVLTRKGNRFISHNGETIAHNSGQSNWIAKDKADYVAKAIHFSADLCALARLRSGLRAQVLASPLFDANRFARNFETAMQEIWDDYSAINRVE